MELSAEETEDKLKVLPNRIDSSYDDSSSGLVSAYIYEICACIGFFDNDALEARNKLAEELGKSKK